MADRLYFDGQCPLCRREMATLARWKDETLVLQDIHDLEPWPEDTPDRATLLHTLHLKTDDGRWVLGLEANVRAWSHTRLGVLWKPLLWPGLHAIVAWVYRVWADRRFQRRYRCEDGCRPPDG